MKMWQIRLEQHFSADDAPAVLTRDLVARFADSVRRAAEGTDVPASTLTRWIQRAIARDRLVPVKGGLYLNHFRRVQGQLADATPWLYLDGVVSLNTVLGDSGVLNNPSNTVTVVVPMDRGPPPRLGRQRTRVGTIHAFGLPRHILEAGVATDRLEAPNAYDHVRATPEKALIDWLYLGRSPRSRRTLPPSGDIDMAMLDHKRLRRLAKAAGVTDALMSWQSPGAAHPSVR